MNLAGAGAVAARRRDRTARKGAKAPFIFQAPFHGVRRCEPRKLLAPISASANPMLHDPWLRRWLPLLGQSARTRPVLEIGCGTGADTSTLVKAGFPVVAFDISATSVAATRVRVPEATVHCQDVRAPFPLGQGEAGAIVASLSLHYFPWTETVDLVGRIRQTLAPGGVLLCRLNSTEDRHFGAAGHPAIEPNYFLVQGQPKRFFDESSVDSLFASGWDVLSREHQMTRKYGRSKFLWEVVAQRDA